MISPNDPAATTPSESSITNLHVFLVVDDGERFWYVATSAEESESMHFGWLEEVYDVENPEEDDAISDAIQIADDYQLTIMRPDDPDIDDERTQSCREWCQERGEGLLCTTLDD